MRSLPFLGVVALLVLLGAAWCGARLYQTRRLLTQARDATSALAAQLRAGDSTGAPDRVREIARKTDSAVAATADPVMRLYARLPVSGPSLRVTRGLAVAADDLADDVLPGLVDAAGVLSSRGKTFGATVDIAPFRAAVKPLTDAGTRLREIRAGVAALPLDALHPVDDARKTVLERLDRLDRLVTGASASARLVPDMLGGSGVRRYFVAIQNNAEARATGGLIGAFAIFRADRGRLTLEHVGANEELVNAPRAPVDMGAEFRGRYARFASDRFWLNANMSPHFPHVGKIVTALWRQTQGNAIDGVLAVDPIALARILEATGPASLPDGRQIDAGNAAFLTLADFYARFPTGGARNDYLKEAVRAVYQKVAAGNADPQRLAERLGRAVLEGHVQVYSARAPEQAILTPLPISGSLPRLRTPYLQVVTQDAGGSKLDYYLRRKVTVSSRTTNELVDVGLGSPVAQAAGVVEVQLTNTAPKTGLPDYVVIRGDLPPGAPRIRGQQKVYLSVYLAVGAQATRATLDGKPVLLEFQTELGHGIASTTLTLDPGQTRTLRLEVYQPTARGARLFYRQQPLVVPDEVIIDEG